MIPTILIVLGALLVIAGILGLLSILFLPLKERLEIVYDREYDFIRSRMDAEIRRHVWHEKRYLTRDFGICCIIGLLLFGSGVYLGYTEKGEGFWFYKHFLAEEQTGSLWDAINEEGQYVAEDGRAYTYYILVSGQEISLSSEPCGDLSDLKSRLEDIRRESTVMLIDSFSVSSTYHDVKELLNDLGIEYEETR